MFWVKTAFRVGWDTSFQPLGWATSSTTALSLWRENASGTKNRDGAKLGLRTAEDSEVPWIKTVGTVSSLALQCDTGLFCLFYSVSALKTARGGRGHAGAEVCHCWHRQGRMPGQFSSVTVSGSTSVVLAVCLEAVPGRCIWSVSWAQTGFVSAVCPMGWKSLSRTYSAALFKWQILCFESV